MPPARWQVSWYDNTGKLTTETIANKTQAIARQSEIERTLPYGTYGGSSVRVKFAEMAVNWLDAWEDLRTVTWSNYRRFLDIHVFSRWDDLSLNTMLNADENIEVSLADLVKSTKASGSGLPPSHARLAYLTLFMVLRELRAQRIARNPACKVQIPPSGP